MEVQLPLLPHTQHPPQIRLPADSSFQMIPDRFVNRYISVTRRHIYDGINGSLYGNSIKSRDLYEKNLDVLIETVGRHNGKLFGGLVRNYVQGHLRCRDIDIWFQTETDRDQFVEDFSQREQFNYPFRSFSVAYQTTTYPFSRSIGQWITPTLSDSNDAIIVDLVVCDHFPVNDFTINLLSLDGSKRISCENPQYSIPSVMRDMKNCRLSLLPSFDQILRSADDMNVRTALCRIYKFMKYGYSLSEGGY